MSVSSFVTLVKTEARLQWRRVGFKLYLGFLVVLALVVTGSGGHNHWLDTLVQLVNNFAFFQLPLLTLLIASTTTRYHSLPGEWLWSSRLEATRLILAQVTSALLLFGGTLFLPLTVGGLLLVAQDSLMLSTFPLFVVYSWGLLLPIIFLELTLALALSLIVQRLVLVLLFVVGLAILLWFGLLLPSATLLAPMNFTLLTLNLDSIAGLGAERSLIAPLFLLYSSLGLVLLTIATWIFTVLEKRSGWQPGHGQHVALVLLLGITGMIGAAISYGTAAQVRTVPPPITEQVNFWEVVQSSHVGQVLGEQLTIEASLSLSTDSEQAVESVYLALNPGLHVTSATLNGQAANASRAGEGIYLSSDHVPRITTREVVIKITYEGTPVLLREDYVAPVPGGDQPPAFTYRRDAPTYLDAQTLLLLRDGDWRAWPLISGPHISQDESVIELQVQHVASVHSDNAPSIASLDTYRWDGNIPQLLLVAAPYERFQTKAGTAWLGPFSLPTDVTQSTTILALRRELDIWLDAEPAAEFAPSAITLPYITKVIWGASLMGLPAIDEFWQPYDSNVTVPHTMERTLATALSRAWLADALAWPEPEFSTMGKASSVNMECGPPDETGQQQCEMTPLGSVNPQAPHGRLMAETSLEDQQLKEALSVVMGQVLAMQLTEDTTLLEREQAAWKMMSQTTFDPEVIQNISQANNTLRELGLLPRVHISMLSPNEMRQFAQLVLDIRSLYNQLGPDSFAHLLNDAVLHHAYPRPPLTEDIFWQLANEALHEQSSVENSGMEKDEP